MTRIRTRRILASVLSAALLFTSMPTGVLAAEYAEDEALFSMQEDDVVSAEQTVEIEPEDSSEEEYLVAADEDGDGEESPAEEVLQDPDGSEAPDGLTGLTAADLIDDPEAEGAKGEDVLQAARGEDGIQVILSYRDSFTGSLVPNQSVDFSATCENPYEETMPDEGSIRYTWSVYAPDGYWYDIDEEVTLPVELSGQFSFELLGEDQMRVTAV